MQTIGFEDGEAGLDWLALCDALEAGHQFPKGSIEDSFLYRGDDTILSRAAWIDGLGALVKTATVFPGNPARGRPMIGGAVTLFDDQTGVLAAVIDFTLVTKWKTAGDSLLAARKLKPEADRILIVGAGTVGRSVREAFGAGYPGAEFAVWNRTQAGAEAIADRYPDTKAITDLADAVSEADIIVTGTMSTEPVIKGAWLRPGQHLNMIGAYRPDMREADDEALLRSKVFVDSRDTTLGHIGELKIPLEQGVIASDDIVADYYDIARFQSDPEDITLFKNGGGAHLDLMTAHFILSRYRS
ncbi:ornithine cyclodeaminase family protein [Shimia ponticola]|uniref:ornithine cyclodeaminase family protein n=1 Tax=Shimia ponticola TaxID=2582893 RepID=UPI0011BE3F8D|nr:NAD(P)-binding domain-containing protein [Shimia ponticola]